jgi:hypothetical protein
MTACPVGRLAESGVPLDERGCLELVEQAVIARGQHGSCGVRPLVAGPADMITGAPLSRTTAECQPRRPTAAVIIVKLERDRGGVCGGSPSAPFCKISASLF